MNRQSIPVLRRVGLAAGVAALAAIGGGVAAGATVPGTTQAAAQVAACATTQLMVWYGQPSGAAAGSSYIPLEFSNIGTTDCALDGFPGVSGVALDSGAQLGSSATWGHVIEPSNVVLAPGGTAHVVLQIVDVYNYPTSTCEPTKADLRVYPPNQKASVVLPFSFEACAKSGDNYLSVDPVNAGVGIPLYTNS